MQHDLPQLLLQKLLLPLTELFLPLSGNNTDAAWDNATDATTSFDPRTPNEFRLATRIAIVNIRANQLAAQSADPSLPPAVAIRMSQCALSYMREADKAERRLEKLQTEGLKEEKAQPASKASQAEQPAAPAEETATQTEPPATLAKEATAQAEQPAAQSEETLPQTEPSAAQAKASVLSKTDVPAYKRLKQLRRQQKQRDREARTQAKVQGPDLPIAA